MQQSRAGRVAGRGPIEGKCKARGPRAASYWGWISRSKANLKQTDAPSHVLASGSPRSRAPPQRISCSSAPSFVHFRSPGSHYF